MNTPLPSPIDYAERYRQHLQACRFQPKPASAWDARAADSSWQRRHDDYCDAFLGRLDLSDVTTVLDVGCGPGLLSLPIARQVQHVHALDYSRGMREGLHTAIAQQAVPNITPWALSWTDDWREVPRCDLAIASRSLMVPDLQAALQALDAHALQRACITFATGPRAGVVELAALLGREQVPMPDHRYPINMLLEMGRAPQVDYLPESQRDVAQDAEGLVRQAEDLFGVLDEDERQRVRHWHARSPHHRFGMAPTRRWAFIQWATT